MNIKIFLTGIVLVVLSKFIPFFFILGLAAILSSFDAKFSENNWRAKYHP